VKVPEEIRNRQAGRPTELTDAVAQQIQHVCKRAFRALELSGYARIDLRMDAAGNVWVLEANPNPQIARGEDFARVGGKGRDVLRSGAAAHHQLGRALAAGERRMSAYTTTPTMMNGASGARMRT